MGAGGCRRALQLGSRYEKAYLKSASDDKDTISTIQNSVPFTDETKIKLFVSDGTRSDGDGVMVRGVHGKVFGLNSETINSETIIALKVYECQWH